MSVLMNAANISIVGNLTRDPELRQRAGQTVCDFSVGVHTDYKQNEEYVNNYYECSLWGKRGETFAQRAKKGDLVSVRGSVALTSYLAKDGQQKSSLHLSADAASVARITGGAEAAPAQPARNARAAAPKVTVMEDDDPLPF